MQIVTKIIKTIRRKVHAYKLGIRYTRASNWELPDEITLNAIRVNLKGPKDVGTKIAFLDIFLDDCYGLRSLNKRKIKTVLDIGGHVGFFSLHARSLFPGAIIHCYEPNPALKDYINHQARVGNFKVTMEAVGLKSGTISLNLQEDSVQTVAVENVKGTIKMSSFKESVKELGGSIDILKLDCEGAEWEILKEESDIWKKINYLCMEYHLIGNHTRKEILTILSDLGYKVIKHEETGITWGLIHACRN